MHGSGTRSTRSDPGAGNGAASKASPAAGRDLRLLDLAALAYGVGLAVHTADHVRRGLDAITDQVLWAGNAGTVIALAALALVAVRHRLAPLAAVAAGASAAVGVSAVHLLPDWGSFSDPLTEAGSGPLTWIAVGIEIVGAAALALAGANVLRRAGWVVRR